MTKPTVALVYGRVAPDASEDEKDVLVQVGTVRSALASLGRRTMDVPVTLDLASAAALLQAAAPVVAFNLAETIGGKGSLIHVVPSLLESLGIPFTGAPCEAIVLTSHKLLAKKALAAEGIRTPRWVTAADASSRSSVAFPPSWIVKSVWEHASIGLSDSAVVRSAAELAAEIRKRSTREPLEHLFVEQYVEGREFNLALLGGGAETPQSLPPAEIRFMDWPAGKPRMVGWRAKWDESSPEYTGTPRTFDFPQSDAPLLGELVRISRACWRLFSLRGYARVDFRVDAAGTPWVLEINTNPCLAPDAGFMAAALQAGLTIEDVVERIVADAAVTKAACTE